MEKLFGESHEKPGIEGFLVIFYTKRYSISRLERFSRINYIGNFAKNTFRYEKAMFCVKLT